MKKTFNQFKKGLEELYWPKAGDEAKFMGMHGQYKAADVGGPETHNDSVFKGTIVNKDESHASTDSERHPDAQSELNDTVKNMHSKSTDEILKTVSQLNLSTDPKHREIRDVLNKELMARYKTTLPHGMREEKEEDSEPGATGNEHPIMQLKAGVDRGGVNFKTKGGKTVKLSKKHSMHLLAIHNALGKAEDKSRFASAVHSDPIGTHRRYFGESVEIDEADGSPSLSPFYNLGAAAAKLFVKKKQAQTPAQANKEKGPKMPAPKAPATDTEKPAVPSSSSGRANLRGTLTRPKPGSPAARNEEVDIDEGNRTNKMMKNFYQIAQGVKKIGPAGLRQAQIDTPDKSIKGQSKAVTDAAKRAARNEEVDIDEAMAKSGDTGWRPMSKKTQDLLARRRPARELARNAMRAQDSDDKDDKSEANEANDGNLANNAKPYDKVTRGDVIAGRLGKDEMGGKRKVKEDLDEAYRRRGSAMSPLDPRRDTRSDAQKAADAEKKKNVEKAMQGIIDKINTTFTPKYHADVKADLEKKRNAELVKAGRKPIGEEIKESSHELKGMSLDDLRDKKNTAENGRRTYERAATAAARAGNDSEARRHRAKANQHDDDLSRINAAIKNHPDNPKNEEVDLEEAVQNPYAVGMAAAMKSTGDQPPLEKPTIKKAHKIARGIMKNEEIELEDEIMTETIELEDGNTVEIDIELAERIADLFEGLTEENQEALADMLHSNLESFMDVVEFVENQLSDEEE